jgi:hypothetical protein
MIKDGSSWPSDQPILLRCLGTWHADFVSWVLPAPPLVGMPFVGLTWSLVSGEPFAKATAAGMQKEIRQTC